LHSLAQRSGLQISIYLAQPALLKTAGRTGTDAIFAVEIDVSKEESVERAFDTVARTCGGLDLVVSNAGILRAGSVLEQSAGEFRMVNDVNYIGFFNVAQHASRLFTFGSGLEHPNGIPTSFKSIPNLA